MPNDLLLISFLAEGWYYRSERLKRKTDDCECRTYFSVCIWFPRLAWDKSACDCLWWDIWSSWPIQTKQQTAATPHTSHTVCCSPLKSNTIGPVHFYSSNQWPTILTGDTAVCWVEGDRWETGMGVCVCACSSMCKCLCSIEDGGTGELARLILSHTDNGMLSQTPDGLWETVCMCVQTEIWVFQKGTDSQLHRGWASKRQIVLHSELFPLHSSAVVFFFFQARFPILPLMCLHLFN